MTVAASQDHRETESGLYSTRVLVITVLAIGTGLVAGAAAGLMTGLSVTSAAGFAAGVVVGVLTGLASALTTSVGAAASLHALVTRTNPIAAHQERHREARSFVVLKRERGL